MQQKKQPYSLITGASSGIGLELARCFARDGTNLVIVARNSERLDRLARQLTSEFGIDVVALACDLSDPASPRQLYEEVKARDIDIGYLVNNAGIGSHGPFTDSSPSINSAMININVTAVAALTHCFLPSMIEHGFGNILNVASLVAYQPGGPQAALYFATKSFVLSFSRGLSKELKNSDVSVTALCPGPTESSFSTTGGFNDTRLYRLFHNSSDAVALAGYRAMKKGKRTVVPGLINKLLAFGGELPPRRIALAINGWLLTKPTTTTMPEEAK